MNDTIRKQIMAVRATGETNMLDTRMVQVIANRMGFYEPIRERRPSLTVSTVILSTGTDW